MCTQEELNRIVLPTGNRSTAYRHEVNAGMSEWLLPRLNQALKGERVALQHGYQLTATATGGVLTFKLYFSEDVTPLLTCVCAQTDDAAALAAWRCLRTDAVFERPQVELPDTLSTPWLVVDPHVLPNSDPRRRLEWQGLGDAEECLAWAWLAKGR